MVQGHLTIAESASWHGCWCEYDFLVESQMEKRQ
jgi:hypothetical protein